MGGLTWRPIEGWPGYEVSDAGQVRSNKRGCEWRILTPHVARGYEQVRLCDGERSATKRVHLLVAEAFLGPKPLDLETRHMDGDRRNNAASNLRYGTRSQNRRDRIEHGTDHNLAKTHCPAGHPYDAANTRFDKAGSRHCRACHLIWMREWKAARRVTTN